MNLRCIYCQTPFTLSRSEMLGAIVSMNEKGQNHYDAHCPRCRRANSISRQRMELFFPNWQEAAKQQAAAPVAPPPTPSSTALKTEPISKSMKEAFVRKVEAKKKAAAKDAAMASAAKGKKPAPTATSSAKWKKPIGTSSSPKGKKVTPGKPAATSSSKGKKTPAKGKKK